MRRSSSRGWCRRRPTSRSGWRSPPGWSPDWPRCRRARRRTFVVVEGRAGPASALAAGHIIASGGAAGSVLRTCLRPLTPGASCAVNVTVTLPPGSSSRPGNRQRRAVTRPLSSCVAAKVGLRGSGAPAGWVIGKVYGAAGLAGVNSRPAGNGSTISGSGSGPVPLLVSVRVKGMAVRLRGGVGGLVEPEGGWCRRSARGSRCCSVRRPADRPGGWSRSHRRRCRTTSSAPGGRVGVQGRARADVEAHARAGAGTADGEVGARLDGEAVVGDAEGDPEARGRRQRPPRPAAAVSGSPSGCRR